MSGIRAFLNERKKIKQNWEEIENNNQEILDAYQPEYRYYADCIKNSPVEKRVLYESGERNDQITAVSMLFEAFTKRKDFLEYEHVWVIHKKKTFCEIKEKYKYFENVKFWQLEDGIPRKYYKLIATASYLFLSRNLPHFYVKRENQVYLSIREFHKDRPIGFENGGDGYAVANHMFNLLKADALLVRDDDARKRLEIAFQLRGILEGDILTADVQTHAKEILETVIDKQHSVPVTKGLPSDRKKLLFYGAGMAMNGVTESLLALLNVLDYTKYDVTVYCQSRDGIYSRKNIKRIDKRVRVLVIRGIEPLTREEQLLLLYLKTFGLSDKEGRRIYQENKDLIKRELFRQLGKTSFDYAIDFSGYAIWTPLMFSVMKAKKKLIWEHADLKRDFLVKNSRILGHKATQLEGLLSIYPFFDKIVAVNRPLMELNRRELGNKAIEERFCHATNMIDAGRLYERISDMESESMLTDEHGKKYLVYDSEETSVNGVIKMMPLAKEEEAFYFVTMGRLSQEKNHQNLLLAFREFIKKYPKSRLFVIGRGLLMDELQKFTEANKMERHVIFTGNLTNPYMLMKYCDCFIFPSRYEGQGLAVLEARVLQMPIILSNYETSSSVCVEGGQYMIGMETEDILQGMYAYADGKVPKDYAFHVDAYNRKAIEEFYYILED